MEEEEEEEEVEEPSVASATSMTSETSVNPEPDPDPANPWQGRLLEERTKALLHFMLIKMEKKDTNKVKTTDKLELKKRNPDVWNRYR